MPTGSVIFVPRYLLKAEQGQTALFGKAPLKPSSPPLIALFIKTEVGHLQNGRHLATLSVPPSCQHMFLWGLGQQEAPE